MEAIIVNLYPGLEEPGNSLSLASHLDEGSYCVGKDIYKLAEGIDYDIVLTNTGEAVLLTGMAYASVLGDCARCLEPVQFDISGEVEGYFLFNENAAIADELAEDEFEYVAQDDTIDISGNILAALVIETPLMLLCSEDCLGLCPHCGIDLNKESCECAQNVEAEPAKKNAFSVLKDLDLN